MNRRDIIKAFLSGSTVLLVAPLLLTSCETQDDPGGGNPGGNNNSGPLTIDITSGEFAALASAGGYAVKNGIIIINTGGDAFVALSAICTHQGCVVGYNSSAGNIQCGCHGSVFSTGGAVLNGPASTPLAKYTVSKSGNILTINT
jgi:cytochrome b6-f complex iron-sulfur subunit